MLTTDDVHELVNHILEEEMEFKTEEKEMKLRGMEERQRLFNAFSSTSGIQQWEPEEGIRNS